MCYFGLSVDDSLVFKCLVSFCDNDAKMLQKLGLYGQQNAIRCGLWWAEMLKAGGQYKEAANVYFRVSGEVVLLSLTWLTQELYFKVLFSSTCSGTIAISSNA